MADVLNVAASMVARELEMTSMRLQKLLYYAHGCHLATRGVPLFSDRIEAWSNGPVVRIVFSEHRGWKTLRHPWPGSGRAGDSDALDPHESDTLEIVQQALADFSADDLVACAHGEAPWRDARGELPDDAWSDAAISGYVDQRFLHSGAHVSQRAITRRVRGCVAQPVLRVRRPSGIHAARVPQLRRTRRMASAARRRPRACGRSPVIHE